MELKWQMRSSESSSRPSVGPAADCNRMNAPLPPFYLHSRLLLQHPFRRSLLAARRQGVHSGWCMRSLKDTQGSHTSCPKEQSSWRPLPSHPLLVLRVTLQSDAHLALELCKGKLFKVHTTGILAKKEQTHVEKKQPRVTPNNSCQLPVGPLCTPMGSRGFSGARVSVSSSVLLPGCYNIYHTHRKNSFSPGPWDEIQQLWCFSATALQVCNQNENTEFQ